MTTTSTVEYDEKNLSANFSQITPHPDPVYGNPCARSSHGFSLLHGEQNDISSIFIYGGEAVARVPLDTDNQTFWCATLRDDNEWQWKFIKPKSGGNHKHPPERIGHAQTTVGNRYIYIFGGRSGIDMNESALSDLWIFDMHTHEWTEILCPLDGSGDDMEKSFWPEARSYHRMLTVGESNNVYMFGGCGAKSGRLADLYKFDTVNKKWKYYGIAPGLSGRGGANLIEFDKNLLAVVGGFMGEECGDAKYFDMEREMWLSAAEGDVMENIISPRSVSICGSLLVDDKRIGMIFGGEVDPSEKGHEGAGSFSSDLLLLSSSEDTIDAQVLPLGDDWPECRGWSDCDTYQNKFIFYGGLNGDDENPTRLSDLWICEVTSKR